MTPSVGLARTMVSIPESRQIEDLLAELLKDPVRAEAFEQFCLDWEDGMSKAAQDCRQLQEYNRVCYLIDFDVLLEYLQTRSYKSWDTYAIDHVFGFSNQPYALPLGAFNELIRWLRRVSGLAEQSTVDLDPRRSTSLVAQLQDEIAGAYTDKDIEPIASDITALVDCLRSSAVATFQRLLKFLTSPRFKGLALEYDISDVNTIASILAPLKRHRSYSSRVKQALDEMDAINIATAIRSARASRASELCDENPNQQGYVLLSRTTPVIRMIATLEPNTPAGRDHMRRLSAMLGVAASESSTALERRFPVMTPSRVVVAEKLGVHDFPEDAVLKARSLHQDCRLLSERLERLNFLRTTQAAGGSVGQAFKQYFERQKRSIFDQFSKLAVSFASPDSGLGPLELFRATKVSIEVSRRQQAGTSNIQEDAVRSASTEVLGLLGEVNNALNQVRGYEYKLEITPDAEQTDIQFFNVLQVPFGIIASGERYDSAGWSAQPYVFRWKVACSEQRFLSAIRDTLKPVGRKGLNLHSTVKFRKVDRNSGWWHSGLMVYTSAGLFGTDITALFSTAGDPPLGVRSVLRSIASQTRGQKSVEFEIEQYRVNTPYGDFLFDLVPAEDEEFRYLSVISDRNLSYQIVSLAYRTAVVGVFHDKLRTQLDSFLGEFPEPDAEADEHLFKE